MGLFASIVKSFMPGKRKRKKRRRGPAASGGGFRPSEGSSDGKVMIANLFGSGGMEITGQLVGMMSQESTLQTIHSARVLKQNLRLGLLERLLLANEEGGQWLEDENADLLIWGAMEDMGTVARLHFLTLTGFQDGQPGSFGLADTLDLPVPLPDDAGPLVRAVAIAALLPASKGSRRGLAERLTASLEPAAAALNALPADTPDECRIAVMNALGNACATAYRYGNKKAMAPALQHYRAADALLDAAQAPMVWAMVNTHLGMVLEADARDRKDPVGLQAAIDRYKAISNTLAREAHANDWALAHVRRAMALYKMASLQPVQAQALLTEATRAFEEALMVYDRNRMPERWAEVMNHYGVAQMALGGYGKADAILQQSISTFRKVLEVRKREAQPLLWAQTANNLGAACFALAKQAQEEHLLEEASYYFQGAIKVFRKIRGQKKKADVIAKNLMRVQHLLSEDAA
ncbi:MAG: tetratricopeptide repeat protein [Rhodospirillales bacterium]